MLSHRQENHEGPAVLPGLVLRDACSRKLLRMRGQSSYDAGGLLLGANPDAPHGTNPFGGLVATALTGESCAAPSRI
jgi:hypothetical protein